MNTRISTMLGLSLVCAACAGQRTSFDPVAMGDASATAAEGGMDSPPLTGVLPQASPARNAVPALDAGPPAQPGLPFDAAQPMAAHAAAGGAPAKAAPAAAGSGSAGTLAQAGPRAGAIATATAGSGSAGQTAPSDEDAGPSPPADAGTPANDAGCDSVACLCDRFCSTAAASGCDRSVCLGACTYPAVAGCEAAQLVVLRCYAALQVSQISCNDDPTDLSVHGCEAEAAALEQCSFQP